METNLKIKSFAPTSSFDSLSNLCPDTTIRPIATEKSYKEETLITTTKFFTSRSSSSVAIDHKPVVRHNFSDRSGFVKLWLGKEIKKSTAKFKEIEENFSLSEFVREKLSKLLKEKNIEVEIPEPDLILRVRCQSCNHIQNTTSINFVKCLNCGNSYRIKTRRGTRIVGIVKGNRELLWRKWR